MGTRKGYDLAVVTGSYVGNDGQEKKKYTNIGVVMQKDDGGMFIIMDRTFNPAGVPYDAARGNQIIVSMFEPRQDNAQSGGQRQGPAAQRQTAAQADADDIPF